MSDISEADPRLSPAAEAPTARAGRRPPSPPPKPERNYDHVRTGRSKAAVKGVIWSTVSSIAPALFGMIVFTATSRALDRADFGLVAFANSIATLAGALVPAGFGEALIQRHEITQRHLSSVFWLCLIFAVVIYIPVCFLAGPIADSMHEPQLFVLIPFLGTRVILGMVGTVPNAILVRMMSFRQMAVRTMVASLAAGIICLGLLWLGFGLWALAVSQLAAAVVTSLGAAFATRWLPDFVFDRKALRELTAFGTFATGYRMLDMLSLDQILIGTLIGPAALGIYSFGRRIFQILNDLIAGALGNASYALLSTLQTDIAKLREAYLFASFTSSVLAFPVFVGLAITADQFIPIFFGHHWIDAVPVVQGFCGIGLLASIGVLQSSLIRSQGQAGLWFYYLVIKQIVTLCYVLMFYSWGINALVTSIVVESFLIWPVAVQMVARILKMSWLEYMSTFAFPALATVFMSAVVLLVKTRVGEMPPIVGLIATVGAGGIAYTAFMALFARRQMAQLAGTVTQRMFGRRRPAAA